MSKSDIQTGRLTPEQYSRNFADIQPALSDHEAKIEAARCLYCAAAPCITACPTGINIPSFIHRIASDNVEGAAQTILDANILGGSCARICPTEILCEQACVRNKEPECVPVTIGRLQRYAVDHRNTSEHPFQRQQETGKTVAVVGAGPAGLACAHHLARQGHQVTLLDARDKPGGLNEYGIAAYKLVDNYAQQEIDFILEIGGIEKSYGQKLGSGLNLDDLRVSYDAVFLGLGLSGSNSLGWPDEDLAGVEEATSAIACLRQEDDLSSISVGRRVVVIGAGNTAIDIACQMKRLGAEEVTIVYRRGTGQMSATRHEQRFARDNGVRIMTWVKPTALLSEKMSDESKQLTGIELEKTALDNDGCLRGTGEFVQLDADTVFKAIGQNFVVDCFANCTEPPEFSEGRIQVNDHFQTSLVNVWAGGDCTPGGQDLAVQAVEHGKQAAHAIHRYLEAGAATGELSHG